MFASRLFVFLIPIFLCERTSAQGVSPEWTAAYSKAEQAVSQLSLQEKASLATGVGDFTGQCIGNTAAIANITFPGLCLEDSALGVRDTDGNSAFPAGINLAATFNRTLMRQRGIAMAQEFRGKGVNVQLGPYMNLMRAPESGRAWEGFGADPFLSGEGAYETIMGIQSQGVQAVAKHFINNEQEHSRMTSSSNVDDRTEHELYLHPFLRSVQANVAAVMCSYNQVNGSYACENNATLNGLLKTELAFQGYVMSDWYATHSTTSANSGLDMTMPGDIFLGIGSYFGDALVDAVNDGSVNESRVDNMATRILAGWYLLGQDSGYPPVNFNAKDPLSSENRHVNVQGDHASLIRTIGAASTILLKNQGGILPLNKPSSIAVIGSGAGSNPLGPNACLDRSCDIGVLGMGWGSGSANYPYLIAPLDSITNRSQADGTKVSSSLSDTDLSEAASVAQGKDVAFVFITADSGEDGYLVEGNTGDRNDLQAWHGGDALVEAVAAVNNNTIVVVNAVGPIIVNAWIEHPNVTALIWSGLPGQEAGNALVDVLYGVHNPSGRLPFTIAKSEEDYPAKVDASFSLTILEIPYTEGLFIDYRHFDAANITPSFEFGFGLSYTTFEYSGLDIAGQPISGPTSPPYGFGSSLDSSLHENVVNVSFSIQNTGPLPGHEVPQLYLAPPPSADSPPRLLKGFDCVFVPAGASVVVTMGLSRYDLSIWNVVEQRWTIPSGDFGIVVGASSRDVRLSSELTVV
ncbi:glycoside hydrolase family 3 protein [Phanerochaete carnosa HHB-10118-sp]|uniref:beta-glucosidase n=1 Tax=Phanerochaete carnosa (strain HHB-10118-sp) TaxID=650164 RepID=K5UH72_PHACS|nr:glycoside hydrolase family 3 protein [Phanerochaete carnosa HHB-10118-sp]EKM48811.1 glycoside hydrolase family 3 protein [Phanerochaete carnosa HHB-10118-sp]